MEKFGKRDIDAEIKRKKEILAYQDELLALLDNDELKKASREDWVRKVTDLKAKLTIAKFEDCTRVAQEIVQAVEEVLVKEAGLPPFTKPKPDVSDE